MVPLYDYIYLHLSYGICQSHPKEEQKQKDNFCIGIPQKKTSENRNK